MSEGEINVTKGTSIWGQQKSKLCLVNFAEDETAPAAGQDFHWLNRNKSNKAVVEKVAEPAPVLPRRATSFPAKTRTSTEGGFF